MPFANTRPCKARLASLQHCFHTAWHPHWSDCGCTARRGIPGKAAIQTVSESFSSQTWYNLMNVWICLNITGYLTDWYFRSCFSTVQDEISSAGELPSAIAKTALLAASERVFFDLLTAGSYYFSIFHKGYCGPKAVVNCRKHMRDSWDFMAERQEVYCSSSAAGDSQTTNKCQRYPNI